MSRERAAAYLCGGTVLIAWFASAAGVIRQPREIRVPLVPSEERTLGTIVSDVQAQSARLRERLAVAPAPQAPIRNPFQFASREPSKTRPAARLSAPTAEPAADQGPPELPLALLGIAEQKTAAGLVRTAMIGGLDGQLYMAGEGQEVAGRYRVVAVGADGAELRDLASGAPRRLALK